MRLKVKQLIGNTMNEEEQDKVKNDENNYQNVADDANELESATFGEGSNKEIENESEHEDKNEKSSNIRLDDVLRFKESSDFELVKDIPVVLTLEVGGRYITIGELLEMKPGEVVPLDREEDESLDVKVNGTLVARGEVVLVENRYGVRLLDIVSTSERLKMIS